MLGSTEIIIIAVVVLVLFGGAAIPTFARSLGRAKKEFEEGVKEGAAKTDAEKKKEKK
jgi:sec-independent protein translocase protein TatA